MLRILIGLLLISSFGQAHAACPPKRDILKSARKERLVLENQALQLKSLLEGTWSGSNAEELFQTYLEAKEERQLRITELAKNLKIEPYRPESLVKTFQCLDFYNLEEFSSELSTLAREIDQARLVFLRLPVSVQEILIDPTRQIGPAYEDVRNLQERLAIVDELNPPLALQEKSLLEEMLKRAQADLVATSAIKSIAAQLKSPELSKGVESHATSIWRDLVDDSFTMLRQPDLNFPEGHGFVEREQSIKKEADQWLQRGIERHYLLLVEAGRLRSEVSIKNGKHEWKPSDWQDIKREIQVVPYRFTGIFYSNFDLSKRLSAQVFRRQLESVEELAEGEDDGRLPKSYRDLFPRGVPADESVLIEPDGGALHKIEQEIDEWKSGKSDEHSLAIYGDKGSGKSTLLSQLATRNGDIRVVAADVPAKLLSRSEVLKFFGHLIGADLEEGGRALMEVDKDLEPTLILLDEAQNLFLSRVGGFEGYKTLLELMGARTENIFWAASFNRYSWAFLNAVFGRNQHFRNVLKVGSWQDDDIKNLIMTRHKRGDWKLSFDAILQAVGSTKADDAAAAIEAKFFKLLWEQSGGNPRAAQDLWLSSLSRMRGKTLRVGLPDDSGLKVLKDVSDDGLFAYAAIVRHENLSTNETTEVTDLPEGTVRYALRLGLDHEFLERSKDGRYRVMADAQRSLILHLRKRNFIYGG